MLIYLRRTFPALAVVTALGAGWLGQPARTAGQLRFGESFRVNSYTTDTQSAPEVASQPDGGAVVFWKG